ncbi:MAG: cobalt-precorrin-4 C(11)-methyltransferase [Fibrobacterota bacterium]|jgi:precorrin-4/cobalt-precorrin-4 C11-methyltransferase
MIWFVGAGPGDPDLLTVKAARLLSDCQVLVWAGSLIHPSLPDLVPADCVRHDSSGMDLGEIVSVLARAHANGLRTVRLHTGEPSLWGAIGEQIEALRERDIPVSVVPGISAFQAAAAAIGQELTRPEVAQAVVLCRAPGRTPVPVGQEPEVFARTGATMCLYLSSALLTQAIEKLVDAYGPECPAALVSRASWPEQRIVRGPLREIPAKAREEGIDRLAVLLVGPALAGKAPPSRLYAAEFSHGWRESK